MSQNITKQVRREIEDVLDEAVKALKRAAGDLGDDAESAVADAAKTLRSTADALADKVGPKLREIIDDAAPKARKLAAEAKAEAQEHPIATAVAAIGAAAAVIQLLGAARKRKPG